MLIKASDEEVLEKLVRFDLISVLPFLMLFGLRYARAMRIPMTSALPILNYSILTPRLSRLRLEDSENGPSRCSPVLALNGWM